MCALLAPLAMAASAIGGVMSAYGMYQQGQTSQKVANNNAITAGYAAQDAQRRGEIAATNAQRQADQVEGATRARLGAGGVDLGVGTAASLQAQNDFFAASNVNAARDNAALESYSDKTQAQNFRTQGAAAAQQGTMGAFSTVLGTVGSVAGKWYSYSNPGTTTANRIGML